MSIDAFDFAEQFQTPIFVMTDLDLGMNNWMSDAFDYPEKPITRGKVLTAEDLEKLGGFARYKDVDGDGVGYRTLPGTNHPQASYFTRGSGHNDKAQYTEREDDYVNNMDRLAHKFEVMRQHVPAAGDSAKPKAPRSASSRSALPTTRCAKAAISCATNTRSRPATCASRRIRSPPTCWTSSAATTASTWWIRTATPSCSASCAWNCDADLIAKLRSVRYYGGLPLDARTVTDDIVRQEGK